MDMEELLSALTEDTFPMAALFEAIRGNSSSTTLLKAVANNASLAKAVKQQKAINLPEIKLGASDEEKKKTLMIIREIAKTLTDQTHYYVASSVLETIAGNDDTSSLSMKLAMGECYIALGREAKGMACVDSVRRFLLSDPTPPAAELFQMAEIMVEAGMHLRALILLPVAAELYMRLPKPDDAAEGMFRCIKRADDCTCHLINEGDHSRVLGIDFGLEFMENCLVKMLALRNIDEKKLAFKHCHVAMLTGFIYWTLRDNAKGIKVRQKAVEHMEKAFGSFAKQHRVFASTYYNMGVGYAIMNKSEQAKNAYVKAIDAAEHATDFEDEAAKLQELQQYRQKLRELKQE